MRWLSLLGVLVATGLAATEIGCSLDDALDGAPCNTNDDCLGDYTCVRTIDAEQSGGVGTCRTGGGCTPGEELGCIVNGSGGCTDFALMVVCTGDNSQCFCCDPSDGGIGAIAADGMSAVCISGEVENSECNDSAACGTGFTCVRTLEQEEEPMESSLMEQAIEPGFCRPDASPTCAKSEQNGCAKDPNSGCSGVQIDVGANPYCCEPSDASGFVTLPYDQATDESSIACTWCPTCDSPRDECTLFTDPSCTDMVGLCGCTPAA